MALYLQHHFSSSQKSCSIASTGTGLVLAFFAINLATYMWTEGYISRSHANSCVQEQSCFDTYGIFVGSCILLKNEH